MDEDCSVVCIGIVGAIAEAVSEAVVSSEAEEVVLCDRSPSSEFSVPQAPKDAVKKAVANSTRVGGKAFICSIPLSIRV